jgi:hypothetical protein
MSVKNAVDTLRTGILFCEENGFIILSNKQMQRLMLALTGTLPRNGTQFYEMLTSFETEPGSNVFLLPDGSAWMFKRCELRINAKRYTQLTVTDITELWLLTDALNRQNEELLKKREQLSERLTHIETLSRERETTLAKIRAHDVLGARLSFMLRVIRSGGALDAALVNSVLSGARGELTSHRQKPSPRDRLDILRQAFTSIGVEVIFDGEFPGGEAGWLAVDIIREAVSNAVRHGFATRVDIKMESANGFSIVITDNGRPPSAEITEGGGLSGIREKVKAFNGTVNITHSPQFTLRVSYGGDTAV